MTLRYPATGLSRAVISNAARAISSADCRSAPALEIEKPGFRKLDSEIQLNVGETKTLDFALTVAGTDTTVDVVAETELVRNTAAIGATFDNTQISQLPINGRNWGGLMTLTPGAVDTGAGNGASVRIFAQGGDDINFRVDGVDATAVRNQAESKSRMMISEDSIAEFRVNSQLYTAETGGSTSAQIEIVSKGGTNLLHGSAFEYLRNSALDSRSPFDGKNVPPFKMNQFGSTLGGPIIRDKTFFFLSYEGLAQRQYITQIGFVPSDAFRAAAVPAVRPLIALYPEGQTPVVTNGGGEPQCDAVEGDRPLHSVRTTGLTRIDHRFTDKLSGYLRLSGDTTNSFAPNASLPYGTRNLDAPSSGLFDFLYLVNPNTTNELRIGANYAQPLHSIPTGAEATISIPSLSSIPGGNRRIAFGISQSIVDQWSTLRGAHTLKAGIEIKRVQLIVHDFNLSDGTASYASLSDFQNDKLNTLAGSGELPTKQMRKIEYFGYVQDEWKIKPNITANIGLRYEFFNAFTEIHDRDIPFSVQGCGGYCRGFGFRESSASELRSARELRVGAGSFQGPHRDPALLPGSVLLRLQPHGVAFPKRRPPASTGSTRCSRKGRCWSRPSTSTIR